MAKSDFLSKFSLFLAWWGTAILFIASCSGSSDVSSADSDNTDPGINTGPPNIVFIVADDLGWADLPTYGNEFNETPNIDALAKQGMKFTNSYASYPICTPSRASMQTGRYSGRMGIINVFSGGQARWKPYEKVIAPTNKIIHLPLDEYTLGEMMKDAGYKTAIFGKWHLGFKKKYYPDKQGYDESIVFKGGGYYNLNRRLVPSQHVPDDKPLPVELADLGTGFIERNKENSFFLTLTFYEPHLPLDAEENIIKKFENKTPAPNYTSNPVYAAQIKMLDNAVGRIQKKLEQEKIAKNTVIVFYSDNGGFSYSAPMNKNGAGKSNYNPSQLVQPTSNKPLKEGKGTIFEGGNRVPLIIRWPDKIKEGSVSDVPVTGVDLFPTFAQIAGYNLTKLEKPIDGESIMAILKGANTRSNSLFWHYPVYRRDVPASAVRKGNWKLIQFLDDNHVELYNLANDISETTNLADKRKNKVDELKGLLIDWRRRIDASMPVANPKFDPGKRDIREKDPRDPRY